MENREKIIQHLDKIEQYAQQHPWLLEELKRRFGSAADGFNPDDRNRLKKIEQYLSLDYDFKQVAAVAGYDYIDVPQLQEKLVLDWREMQRYRYGIAARPISYVNFCSHAHFQAEGIVNYYHYKRNDGICDVDWFNSNIDEYVSTRKNFNINHIQRVTSIGKPTTLDAVVYNTKKVVLFNVLEKQNPTEKSWKNKVTEISMILSSVQKIRNGAAVHRSPTDDGNVEMTYSFEAIAFSVSELNKAVKSLLIY